MLVWYRLGGVQAGRGGEGRGGEGRGGEGRGGEERGGEERRGEERRERVQGWKEGVNTPSVHIFPKIHFIPTGKTSK